MNKEVWLDIAGFEGFYQVSQFGNIRSLYSGKNLKPGIGSTGYYLVILSKGGIKKTAKVHRVVATAFLPNPKDLPFVNHVDSNRLNNHISNLEWCDNAGNMQHCFSKGRGVIPIKRGESNVNAKVNTEIVREIRRMYSAGLLPIRISEQMGYSLNLVYNIIKRKTWKHV